MHGEGLPLSVEAKALSARSAGRGAGDGDGRATSIDCWDLVVALDTSGRIRRASGAVERLFGSAAAEVHGQRFLEYLDEDDRRRLALTIAEARRTGLVTERVGFRARHRDGKVRVLQAVAVAPEPGTVVVYALDVDRRAGAAVDARVEHTAPDDIVQGLGNLLAVISLYSEFILAELPADHPVAARAGDIAAAAQSAAALTRRLQSLDAAGGSASPVGDTRPAAPSTFAASGGSASRSLRRVPEPPAAPGDLPAGGGRREAETILVVEDEAQVRELLCDVLQLQGYTVLVAREGEEALTVSAEHGGPIDLVIVDVVMPGVSGQELVERLASSRPRLRSLYISGYTNDLIRQHGLLRPGRDFLQKPFTVEALTQKVRALLDAAR